MYIMKYLQFLFLATDKNISSKVQYTNEKSSINLFFFR